MKNENPHIERAKIVKNSSILVILWTVIFLTSLIWNIKLENNHMKELSLGEARAYLKLDHSIHLWATEHGGVYVKKNTRTVSNPNLSHLPNRDITITDGDTLTLMNPELIIRQMFDEHLEEQEAIGHLISHKPLAANYTREDWEIRILYAFEKGVKESIEFTEHNGVEYLRLMQPLITEKGCLKCHAQQGYSVGDIRGGHGVSILMKPYQEIANQHINSLILFHSIILVLGIIGIILVAKYFIEYNEELKFNASKLREKDERLKLAIECTRDGVWDWNVTTGEVFVTEKWAQMIGYTLTEISPLNYQNWCNLVNEDDLIKTEELLKKHLTDHSKHYISEFRMKHKSGDWIWILSRGKVVQWDTNNNPLRMTGTHIDITERKHIQKALQENENRMREAQRVARLGSFEYNLKAGEIFWTPELYEIFGLSSDEFQPTIEEFSKIIHPDDREVYLNSLMNPLTKGKKFRNEFRAKHKSNNWRYYEVYVNVIIDDSFEVIGLQGTVQDINDKKNAELRYRTVADFTYSWEYWQAPDKSLIYISPACEKISGYNAQSFLNDKKLLSSLVLNEDKEIWHKHEMENEAKFQGEREIQFRIRKQDGSTVWISHMCRAIINDEGTFLGYRATNRDITSEVKHKEKLIYAIEQKEQKVTELQELNKKIENEQNASLKLMEELQNEICERERTRKELKESEERFKALHNASFGGITIHDSGLIKECNYGLSEITGYSISELIGMDGMLLIGEKSRELVRSKIINGDERSYEALGLRKNGEEYPVRLEARNIPYKGKQVRVVEFRDISEQKLAEKKQRESEEKFKSIVTNTEEILFMIDINGIFTLCEGLGLSALDLLPGELVGQSVFNVFKEYSSIISGVNEALNGKKYTDVISIGETYLNIWYSPHKDSLGNVLGILGMAVNNTDKIIAERNVLDSEKRIRSVIESATDSIISINDEGIIISWNNASVNMFGFTVDEAVGKNINDIMPHGSKVVQSIKSKFINKKPAQIANRNPFEFNGRHRNGWEFPIELSLSSWEISKTQYFTAIIRDISERKKNEMEIIRLKNAVEQCPISVVISDLDGKIEYVNDYFTKATGYSKEEATGQNPRLLEADLLPHNFFGDMWETIVKDEIWKGEYLYKKKNGEFYWENTVISPIKDKANKIINFVAIKEDITKRKEDEKKISEYQQNLERLVDERTNKLKLTNKKLVNEISKRKNAEEKLKTALVKEKEVNELKTRFISTVSHELRTPLTAIKSSAELLKRYEKKFDDNQKKEQLIRIINSVGYLVDLSEDVLMMGRTESGKIIFEPKLIDLKELVQEIVTKTEEVDSRAHVYKYSFRGTNQKVFCDSKLIRIIVTNIVNNAVKYSPQKSTVKIIVSIKRKIKIEIIDEGIGIPDEGKELLFEPFYRASNVEKYKGSGLGLSIVQRSIEILNGSIKVESKINEGSKFIIEIPTKS